MRRTAIPMTGHAGHKIYDFTPEQEYLVINNAARIDAKTEKAEQILRYESETDKIWFFRTKLGFIYTINKLIPSDEFTICDVEGKEIPYRIIIPRKK